MCLKLNGTNCRQLKHAAKLTSHTVHTTGNKCNEAIIQNFEQLHLPSNQFMHFKKQLIEEVCLCEEEVRFSAECIRGDQNNSSLLCICGKVNNNAHIEHLLMSNKLSEF
jgi:hypothetical protein